MKDKNTYNQRTREFKLQAVKMCQEPGRTVADVARELGIRENELHAWRKLVTEQGEHVFPGRGRRPQDEMSQLKRENSRLREENEILKKAAIFFAKATGGNTNS